MLEDNFTYLVIAFGNAPTSQYQVWYVAERDIVYMVQGYQYNFFWMLVRTKLTHNILLLNLRVEPPSPLKPINSIESRKNQIVIFYEILQPTYKYYVPKTSIKDTSGHRCLGTGMCTHQTTEYAYASIHVFHKFYSNFTPTYQEFKIRVLLSFPYGVSVAPPPKQYFLYPVHLLAHILLYFVAVTCTQTRAKKIA